MSKENKIETAYAKEINYLKSLSIADVESVMNFTELMYQQALTEFLYQKHLSTFYTEVIKFNVAMFNKFRSNKRIKKITMKTILFETEDLSYNKPFPKFPDQIHNKPVIKSISGKIKNKSERTKTLKEFDLIVKKYPYFLKWKQNLLGEFHDSFEYYHDYYSLAKDELAIRILMQKPPGLKTKLDAKTLLRLNKHKFDQAKSNRTQSKLLRELSELYEFSEAYLRSTLSIIRREDNHSDL